ncbi:MAG: nucleotide sugar dehydrogenase [Nitrosarchaeum sp.]|nr:nucleotide sugar dehydrogenase [Nitrosarchaeum sp.]
MQEELQERINSSKAQICVVGLGQVGLPVALSFCNVGFVVRGLDVDKDHIELLKNGKSPFEEPILEEMLIKSRKEERFFPTLDQNAIAESDVIIVCVPTPISKEIKPDLSLLKNACDTISRFELKNKLIVIESSIPPKTFESMILPSLSGDKTTNIFASYVPERLSPGQAFEEINTTPRVIGARDQKSRDVTYDLYKKIIKADIFKTSPIVAETCKLVENTFRDVNIALANEIAMICERYDIDVLEIQKICNSHPRVNLLTPGPGVGGPCLPKDPYLLLNPQDSEQIDSKIISNARKINDYMPSHVFHLIENTLKEQNKEIKNSTITILGTAYKGNVSDTRYSPSEKIASLLLETCSNVKINDPHSKISFGAKYEENISKAIKNSDVVVILTDHDEYKNINLQEMKKDMNDDPILIDTRRIFDKEIAENVGFTYVSIGYNNKGIKNNYSLLK